MTEIVIYYANITRRWIMIDIGRRFNYLHPVDIESRYVNEFGF